MKLRICESDERDLNYISLSRQIAEDLYEELKADKADDNTVIGQLYSDEYPDCMYYYFKVMPYGIDYRMSDNQVLTYRVYGDQYTKFLDERLEYVDLCGEFRSAWSDYKIDKYNKCIEVGIKFMFNVH